MSCWPWTAGTNNSGYGAWKTNGEAGAHRVVYQMFKGPIPKGMLIRHDCDNRRCCNPAHMRLGTKRDNGRDMVERGRDRHYIGKGSANGNSKLTESQVAQIRYLYEYVGGYTQAELGKAYGVSQVMIGNVVRHDNWRQPK